ncbi:hypothetical protein HB777_24265 [Mesorhizobium loti]|nr:hypothetical protein HB777_24265 [Mesorhizobium loti]
MVTSRNDDLGDAVERSLNPLCCDWSRRGRASLHGFALLQGQECSIPYS